MRDNEHGHSTMTVHRTSRRALTLAEYVQRFDELRTLFDNVPDAVIAVANTAWTEGQIDAVGYAESQPLAGNETAEGRAQNRRIDVILRLPPLGG